jgi:uncharacterized protein (TIGR02147 family)
MAKSEKEISVYSYLNYRSYLHDKFRKLKATNPRYSYRLFNRLAGLSSPSFLQMVIAGKRNLTSKSLLAICRGFKLGEKEKKYLDILIRLNQSKDQELKDKYFQELLQNKKFLSAKRIEAAQYNLFSRWFYVAILELLRTVKGKKIDEHWIAKHLHPEVGVVEVKKAIADLMELGFLTKNKQDHFVITQSMIATDNEIAFAAATKFHIETCGLAARAVTQDSQDDRELTCLTIAVSEEEFELARERIREFRDSLHSTLEQNKNSKTKVAQINFHLLTVGKN